MWTPRGAWPLIVAVALGAVLVLTPTASARPKAPGALLAREPASRSTGCPSSPGPPSKGADHYEFQLAADKGFNSAVGGNGGKQSTKNTAVTLPTLADQRHLLLAHPQRTAKGATSAWTKTRTVVPEVGARHEPHGPGGRHGVHDACANAGRRARAQLGGDARAAQYAVTVATDPLLTTVITSGGNAA